MAKDGEDRVICKSDRYQDRVSLVAKVEGSNTLYYHTDHLSNRLFTDSSGNAVGTRGHYPFGETWYQTGTTTKWKFTSYERDLESGDATGNDYAMAREYIGRYGRFNSVDPLAGVVFDPQSLNRYTYARNDPVNNVDPSGMIMPAPQPEPPPQPIPPPHFPPGPLLPCTFGINGGVWFALDGVLFAACNDPNTGRIGERGGARGNGQAAKPTRKPHVDQKALADCLNELFKVALADFQESQSGAKGYFTGFGPDFRTNHGNVGPIVVVNDAKTYDAAGIAQKAGNPRAVGFTDSRTPYENFGNNNNNEVGTLVNQVHELGHSLFYITQTLSSLVPEPHEMGSALEDCVRNHHGFVWY